MTVRTHSIQARVLALVLGAAGALWVAVAAYTWVDTRHELDELLDAHLAQSAALLVARQVPDPDEDEGLDAPILHRYAPRVTFQVFHEGRLALRSVNAPQAPIIELAGAGANRFQTVRMDGRDWRVFATRGAQPDVQVLVAEDVHARSDILVSILRGTLAPLLVGLPLLAAGLWWSVRRGLRPLNLVGRALAARPADDFTPVARADAPSEMKPMLDALDNLFTRIAALMESERRFTADAAHELRTPLAAIRAQAQVALGEADPQRRARALSATLEGCDRAARLVDQLLALSRLDALAQPPQDRVDLAPIVRDVLAALAPAALAKQQDLRFDAQAQPATVRGDAALLSALVRNIADNAVRYAPSGASIEISLRDEGGRIMLGVANGGGAPAPGELARLGERFHRALGTGEPGSGLGLSIVRRIAHLHGGDVAFAPSAKLGGLGVTVSLPRAP